MPEASPVSAKRRLPRIAKQEVGHRVVGDEHVGQAVAVIVGHHHSQAVRTQRADTGCCAHIGEDPAPVVAIHGARERLVFQRMTIEADSAARISAKRTVRAVGVHVVHHPQIEIAVTIQIGERAARAPTRIADVRRGGDVGERAVAAIAVEHVGPVVGDVQVGAAVAVDVASAGAHPVLAMADPGTLGDVGERAVAAVAVEPMLRPLRDRCIGKRPAVDDEDVDPAVAVVVEEQPARSHRLDEMFVGAGAVGMAKRDAGLVRDIDELRKRIVCAGARSRRHRRPRRVRNEGHDARRAADLNLHRAPP